MGGGNNFFDFFGPFWKIICSELYWTIDESDQINSENINDEQLLKFLRELSLYWYQQITVKIS